jgi:hypothetical protein
MATCWRSSGGQTDHHHENPCASLSHLGEIGQLSLEEGTKRIAGLLLSRNPFLDAFIFLFKSLIAVKENGAVLYFHPVGIPRLAPYDCRLLALVSPVSDDDLFSYGKVCH